MTPRRHESPRGISRPRYTDIDYGNNLGPPLRSYEADALRSGQTDISVEEWDQLAGDWRPDHQKERTL